MYEIVLIRHGESVWNKENRFTGEMHLNNILNNLKNKHSNVIYFIENKDNQSRINLSDENILGIKYLPE